MQKYIVGIFSELHVQQCNITEKSCKIGDL